MVDICRCGHRKEEHKDWDFPGFTRTRCEVCIKPFTDKPSIESSYSIDRAWHDFKLDNLRWLEQLSER